MVLVLQRYPTPIRMKYKEESRLELTPHNYGDRQHIKHVLLGLAIP